MAIGTSSALPASGFRSGVLFLLTAMAGVGNGAFKYESDRAWVQHSTDVQRAVDTMRVAVAELADRDRAEAATETLAGAFAATRRLTADNPLQQHRLTLMAPMVAEAARNGFGLRVMVERVAEEEMALYRARTTRARRSLQIIYASTGVGLCLALALFVMVWSRLVGQVRAQAETLRQLKQSEAQSAALVEHGMDLVWAVDGELRLTAGNLRFRELFGRVLEPWHAPCRRALAGERVTLELAHEIVGVTRHFLISFGPIVVDGRVTGASAFAKDITARRRAEMMLQERAEALRQLTVVDPLTELHNRRGFLELGDVLLREARAQRQAVRLLYIDLDGLKQINDERGHAAGDEAIRAVAALLQACTRRSDVVARLGGDEFVVLAVGDDPDEALLARIERRAASAGVGLSVGMVRVEGDEPATLDELIGRADERMYAQKVARRHGRAAGVAGEADLAS